MFRGRGVDKLKYVHFASCFYIDIYCIMGCYYTLCHNTYAYSLLFCKKRENVGSWNSRLEKEQILETYSVQLQKSWNSTEFIFGINKKYWAKKVPEGGHPPSTRVGGAPLPRGPPVGSPVAIFCYMKSFVEEKIISNLSGRDSAATRRNLGGSNLELWQSCSAGDTSLPEGEIITIIITNAPLIGRGKSPSTSSPAPSHLQTLVHLLYPILVSKSRIDASRLLVVLITPCSWC